MDTIIINKTNLADFLSADGEVTGKKLEKRMSKYCAAIQARMGQDVNVIMGETSGEDEIPDDVRDNYEEAAQYVADNLDTLVIA